MNLKEQDNLWLAIDKVVKEAMSLPEVWNPKRKTSTEHTNQIQDLIKEAGYVQLDENQRLPEDIKTEDCLCVGDCNISCHNAGIRDSQIDMLGAGFKKVKGE